MAGRQSVDVPIPGWDHPGKFHSVDLWFFFETLAKCDTEPVMLHCTYGADRTGIATFFLESLLGMNEEDMIRDYLWTQFTQGRTVKFTESDAEFPKWLSKTEALEGDTFADKMENHLKPIWLLNINKFTEVTNLKKI